MTQVERRAECDAHKDRTGILENAMFGDKRDGVAYDMVNVKLTNKIILGLQIVTMTAIIKILVTGA